jgi:hypothetical protein
MLAGVVADSGLFNPLIEQSAQRTVAITPTTVNRFAGTCKLEAEEKAADLSC